MAPTTDIAAQGALSLIFVATEPFYDRSQTASIVRTRRHSAGPA